MALKLTQTQKRLTEASTKEPQLVLEIDGLGKNFFSSSITWEQIKIGDPNLEIGNHWVIGGLRRAERDDDLIGLGGTTTTLSQLIDIDKGRGSSITSFSVNVIDNRNIASELLSPGVTTDEVLFKKARIYLGYKEQPFPDEFTVIFRGLVESVESGAGSIKINITSPDRKKKEKLFIKADSELSSLISDSDTEISVQDISAFYPHVLAPDGLKDPALTFHIMIENEIIEYESIDEANNKFLNCTRGRLGTLAASHALGSQVNSLTQLKGTPTELALKLMLSGNDDYYLKDQAIMKIDDELNIGTNSIKIRKDNLKKFNVSTGDYITLEDSTNSNDFTYKVITSIIELQSFYYILVNQPLNTEGEGAEISLWSKYNTLGYGFQMLPEEVDIKRHEYIFSQYLSSFDLNLQLTDEIEGREFLEKEIYLPSGLFSLPRNAQSSVGILSPPSPNEETVLLDERDIINPDKLVIQRSTSKNFTDSILYKYDYDPLTEKYKRALLAKAGSPLHGSNLNGKNISTITIESKGLRTNNNALNMIQVSSKRRLDIYKNAAEFLMNVQVSFEKGFSIEAGDIVILDLSKLNVTNFNDGSRKKDPALFLVINKRFDIKKGEILLDFLNSSYSMDATIRYGLISPSSKVKQVVGDNQIIIENLLTKPFGHDEGSHWQELIGETIFLRNNDFSIQEQLKIKKIEFNTVTFDSNVPNTVDNSFIMELDLYNDNKNTTKLRYVFMTDQLEFDDGRKPYTLL